MRMHIKALFVLMLAGMLLTLALPAVAQECTIQTVTGTWAFRYTGASFNGGLPSPLTLHSTGAFLLASQVGVLTVNPDGSVKVRDWTVLGPYRISVVDYPATITSIGVETTADGEPLGCAMTLQYAGFLPTDPPTIDKFIVFNNGSEGRGMHISDLGPFTTSTVVAKRITRSLDPAPRCGQQTLQGTYVAMCSGSAFTQDGKTLASAAMFHMTMLPDGAMKGTLYSRIGTDAAEVPVHGSVTVNPDCTGEASVYAPGFLPPDAKINAVFVTYDQGKGGFMMPLEIEMPGGAKMSYPASTSCTLERSNP